MTSDTIQVIKEDGIQIGEERGIQIGEKRTIINMNQAGFTLEQIMLATKCTMKHIKTVIQENENKET